MAGSNWEQGFIKGILREEDGTPSFARVGSLAIVMATIVWVTHVVLKTHVIPDLNGPASFVTTNVLSLYGVNKGVTSVKSIVDKFTGGGNNNVPPQA